VITPEIHFTINITKFSGELATIKLTLQMLENENQFLQEDQIRFNSD